MNFKYFFQIVAFSFVGLAVVGQLYLPIPVLANLAVELNLQAVNPTWLISVFGYSYAVGFLVFGPLADRFGKKAILLLGMILLVMLTVLLAHSEKYTMLIRGLQGFFAASYPPLILAYIGQNFPDKIKGIAISAMSFAFLSAVIIAQLFIVNIADGSFIYTQKILSAIYVLALLVIVFNIQSDISTKTGSLLTTFYNLPKVLLSKELIPYFIYTFTVLLMFVSFYLLLSSASSQFAGNLFSVRLFGFPAMLFTFIVPTLVRIKTSAWVLRVAFMLQFIALLLASVAFTVNSYFSLILSSVIITLATALLVPCLIASIGQRANINMRGTAISLYTFILFCGASSAPVIINFLSSKISVSKLLIAFAVIPVILLIFSLKINRENKP